MKEIFIIIFLNSILILNGFGQQIDSVKIHKDTFLRKNAIYLEYLGNAPKVSLNYERKLIHKDKFAIFGRIGFGMDIVNLSEGNLYVPSIPVELSTSLGKRKHFVELGIGWTPFFSKMEMWSSMPYYHDLKIDSIDYELYFLINPRVGYRYESNKNWLIRVAYTPILYNSSNIYDNYQVNFGLSVGKLF